MSRIGCRGDDPNINMMKVWTTTDDCWTEYYTTMYNKNGRPVYNDDGFQIVSEDITRLLANYVREGYKLTEPGLPGYNVFQDVILRICNSYPGSCERFLVDYCSVQQGVEKNTGLINFCGCYTEQQGYEGNVSKQCQPLCNRVSNVKLPDGAGSTLSCNDNVCVIDQVSIDAGATESSTGGVSFTQVCRCPEGQCKCIIGSVNLYGITGQTQFKQVCGEDSLCYSVSSNPNDPPKPVLCPEIVEPQVSTTTTYSPYITWFAILAIVAIVLIIFIL